MGIKQKYTLVILFACYAIIGLVHSNNQGFWHDEIYTLTFLKGISVYTFDGNTLFNIKHALPIHYCKDILQNDNFLSNFHIQVLHEGHPPLYFLLLKIWALIWGYSEIALRSFSLLSGLASIIIIYDLICKHYKSKFTIWTILLLLLLNPFLFYYFTEARMYAFAFLLATLSFKYCLKYKQNKILISFDFLYFTLASIALLYTHYYGLFFFLSLALYETLKDGISFKLLNYSIPIIIFSPWIFVIKLQTEFHKIHWTDGAISFLDSTIAFNKGLTSLFFSPMSDAKSYEIFFAITAGMAILYFVSKFNREKLIFIAIAVFYFLQIFIFDKFYNRHTIIVPRYYIFILIFLYWAIARSIENSPMSIKFIFSSVYLIIAGISSYQIVTLSLAPKQMYRELAYYLDSKHDANNTIIVVEPGGPTIWGLSYYLKNDFSIISAEYFKESNTSKKIIYIDEMIGDKYWENHLNTENQKKLKLVPFVGLLLYE